MIIIISYRHHLTKIYINKLKMCKFKKGNIRKKFKEKNLKKKYKITFNAIFKNVFSF